MKLEVVAALVGALSAIVVALISLMSSRTSQKASLQAAADLERLRASLTEQAARQTEARQHQQEVLDSLHEAIQVIQRVKNHVQLILSAVPRSVLPTSAIKMIEDARNALTECHERHMTRLTKSDGDALHVAKNATIRIEMRLRRALETIADVADLEAVDRAALTEEREKLTEVQSSLRDSLVSRSV